MNLYQVGSYELFITCGKMEVASVKTSLPEKQIYSVYGKLQDQPQQDQRTLSVSKMLRTAKQPPSNCNS